MFIGTRAKRAALGEWAGNEGSFSVKTDVSAAGDGSQANATALTHDVNVIAICAAQADSVRLPKPTGVGDVMLISNIGAATAKVFPASGGKINHQADNAEDTLATGSGKLYVSIGANNWVSV